MSARNNRVAVVGAWMLENGHRSLLKLTGGRWPKQIMGMPTVELHTRGRKTGERRSTMLTAPILEDDRIVLVASRGGHDEHPGWYKNLVANPQVEITVDDEVRHLVARTASPGEKAAIWPTLVKAYRGYDQYQRSTERDIPVVLCEPPA